MRRTLIPAVVAMVLVTLLGGPATADGDAAREVIPVEYAVVQWNPCTEAISEVYVTADLDIRALPSVEAFFAGEDEHATLKWSGEGIGDDGYTMPWRHFATLTINGGFDGRPLVIAETDNLMFTGPDGGKYRVSYRFHLTEVGGVQKAVFETGDAFCVVGPKP